MAVVVGAIGAYVVANGIVSSGSYTDWGYATAFGIGVAMGPLVDPRTGVSVAPPQSIRWSIGGGWRWVSSPARSRRLLAAQTHILGAVAVASAGALLAFLVWNGGDDIDVPTRTARVAATVVDPLPACPKPCGDVVVRYGVGTVRYQKTLRLPAGVSVRRGESLQLDLDPADPGRAQLPRPARRVNVDGLLGATAIVLACAGAIALAHRRRSAQATTPGLVPPHPDEHDRALCDLRPDG